MPQANDYKTANLPKQLPSFCTRLDHPCPISSPRFSATPRFNLATEEQENAEARRDAEEVEPTKDNRSHPPSPGPIQDIPQGTSIR